MKRTMKTVVMLMATMILTLAMGVGVFAATNQVKENKAASGTLKVNQSVDYKVKVNKLGYIKISVSQKDATNVSEKDKETYAGQMEEIYVYVLNSKKKVIHTLTEGRVGIYGSTEKYYVGVKKGTYYVRLICKGYPSNYTFSYKFTSIKKSCYQTSKKKAMLLKTGKKITSTVLDKPVWYKFKVTKKHKVNINYTDNLCSMGRAYKIAVFDPDLYNAQNKKLKWDEKTQQYKKTLKPGTYYLKVAKFSVNLNNFKTKQKNKANVTGIFSIKIK